MSTDQHWDDFMDLADAVGVTRPEPIHPSVRRHLADDALAGVLTAWSEAAAGIDPDEPIPFTLVVDHAECEQRDCDRTICCCKTGPCPNTTDQVCTHHQLLCDEHRLDCSDCLDDFRADGGL